MTTTAYLVSSTCTGTTTTAGTCTCTGSVVNFSLVYLYWYYNYSWLSLVYLYWYDKTAGLVSSTCTGTTTTAGTCTCTGRVVNFGLGHPWLCSDRPGKPSVSNFQGSCRVLYIIGLFPSLQPVLTHPNVECRCLLVDSGPCSAGVVRCVDPAQVAAAQPR